MNIIEIYQCAVVPYVESKECTSKKSLYQDIKIQQCNICGHEWNLKHESSELISSYGNEIAACVPVTDNMINRFKELCDYVLSHTGRRERTADIGAGSCCFALNFAEHSKIIDIYEPSIQAKEIELPRNVNLINKIFKNNEEIEYDLIVLKQVLEHILEARDFLALIAKSISENGFLYLEIPSGDFIQKMQSCYDYHSQHIHYFKESAIEATLSDLNFKIIDKKYIMNGHDVGYILQKPGGFIAKSKRRSNQETFNKPKARKISKVLIKTKDRVIGIYGINAYSQSFLAVHRNELQEKKLVYFDDNPHAQGKYAANKGSTNQIFSPTIDTVNMCDVIYIACYLHDKVIEKKLNKLGFQGRIVSLRPRSF